MSVYMIISMFIPLSLYNHSVKQDACNDNLYHQVPHQSSSDPSLLSELDIQMFSWENPSLKKRPNFEYRLSALSQPKISSSHMHAIW